MRRLIFIILIIIFFGSVFSVFAVDIEPFVMPSARFAALGGNHAAIGDNFYSLFTNPASFVDIENQFSAAELSVSAYGALFELADLLNSGSDPGRMRTSNIIRDDGFAAGFELGGPLALGWVGGGFGFGIFDRISAKASFSGGYMHPRLLGDILLVGGYSFRFIDNGDHILDAGFLGKVFFRGLLDSETPALNVANVYDDFVGSSIGSNLGLGVDFGIRYTFGGNFTAALVCFDLFSPLFISSYEKEPETSLPFSLVKNRLDAGFKYDVKSDFLYRYISGLTLMADYHDILGFLDLIPRNPILDVGLGMEIRLLNVLTLRAGIGDALPCVGFGIDLNFMTMDFAMHGKELGLDPGVQPVYAFDLAFLFRY